jgi:hypothetical protein
MNRRHDGADFFLSGNDVASGFVLAFHSNNVNGLTYESNDHVALDATLSRLRERRIPTLRLLDVVERLRQNRFESLPPKFACITLDDGFNFDWRDWCHPEYGTQPSMQSILRKHSQRVLGFLWLRKVTATSFVIASPEARRDISSWAFHDPECLSSNWWKEAQASGFMDVGVHSWNHVHPAASEMHGRPHLKEAFARIDNEQDAALQVRDATRFVRDTAGGDSGRLFAYPYGQVSEYLAREYLPRQRDIVAAFGCEPQPLTAASDIWRLPRYVCGWHWKTAEEFDGMLAG